jgi:hypothetical protein
MLQDCFKNFSNIDKPSYSQHELNFFADFIELMSLFANTDGVSYGDIYDRFFGTKEYSENEITKSEQVDNDEIFTRKIIRIIIERIRLYDEDYPFIYDNSEIILLKNNLTFKQKLYLGLLISSKLNIFKEFSSIITTEFESISFFAFQNFLPTNSIVKEFGKNSEYSGSAIDKIKKLAIDLGLDIDKDELEAISPRNNQERGLDIIGWIPFKDNCKNKLIYLAQCACGKDKESKFHDTRRFENYLLFYKAKPQHLMFIPYSLINVSKGKFYQSDLIEKDFLILERKRILSLINEEPKLRALKINKIVDGCIAYQEDIV